MPEDVRKEFEEREGVTIPEREPIVSEAAAEAVAEEREDDTATASRDASEAPARQPEPEEPVRSALADALHAAGATEAFRDEPASNGNGASHADEEPAEPATAAVAVEASVPDDAETDTAERVTIEEGE